jgi:4-hydroxy-tetrahydrodipicolinate synthase
VGCVWGSVNFLPGESVTLYRLVSSGQLNEAASLWRKLVDSQLFVWSHQYNASVKAAARHRGFDVGGCRLPVLPLSEADLSALHTSLASIS